MNACGRQAFAPLPVNNSNIMAEVITEVVCSSNHQYIAVDEEEPVIIADDAGYECKTADMDPTMANDPRIILNMLMLERETMPRLDYFQSVQTDILPFMRKVVTTWMLEVWAKFR